MFSHVIAVVFDSYHVVVAVVQNTYPTTNNKNVA